MTHDVALSELLSPEFLGKLTELRQLLGEAYLHWKDDNGEGTCAKIEEGRVSIYLGAWFWEPGSSARPSVEVYTSFGPYRNHYFSDIDEALAAVREWHAGATGEKGG